MSEVLLSKINYILGINVPILSAWQMAIRALVIYILAVILVRIGKKRFLARPSAFDIILLLILGSVISRPITGNAPFWPTLLVACLLIFVHSLFSYITFYSGYAGGILKGRPIVLIKEGQIQWKSMRSSSITERDLLSALRRNAQVLSPKEVKIAVLERNGEISVVPYPRILSIAEISVKNGVQMVKLELKH